MTAVRVEAPARLHLGVLDPTGEGPRRFGGLGVGVRRPAVVVEASPARELCVEGPDGQRALVFARRCQEALGLDGGARVRIVSAIPSHVGLGSGTKLGLAVASAIAALHDRVLEPAALAVAAGRGARSAVGLWTFARGGLVVEGGLRDDDDRPAPLLARHPIPEDWRCVLLVPHAEAGLSGAAEDAALAHMRATGDGTAEIARLVLSALLPALVERDLRAFGAALTRVQRLVGEAFAEVQGGPFHPRAGALVEALLKLGAAGAGQSSWGPAVYGIVEDETQGCALARRMRGVVGDGASIDVVAFDNDGARIEGP